MVWTFIMCCHRLSNSRAAEVDVFSIFRWFLVACHARKTNYIFEQFYKAIGSYLNNKSKSKTGIWASFRSEVRTSQWIIKLGFWDAILHNQFREMSAHNRNEILEKAKTRVEIYKKRRLSMPSKILLLNVAVFPFFFPGKYPFVPKVSRQQANSVSNWIYTVTCYEGSGAFT